MSIDKGVEDNSSGKENGNSINKKDALDKIHIISGIALGVAGLCAAVYIPLSVMWSNQRSSYLDFATKILAMPVDTSDPNSGIARKFAIDIIKKYPPIEISEETEIALRGITLKTSGSSNVDQHKDYSRHSTSYQSNRNDKIPDISKAGEPEPANDTAIRTVKSGTFQVEIPEDVQSMWVFYQERGNQSVSGCRRAPNADPISPVSFSKRIGELVNEVDSGKNEDLIITAYSPLRQWDGAAREIQINGKYLQPMMPYWCNGSLNYGYRYSSIKY